MFFKRVQCVLLPILFALLFFCNIREQTTGTVDDTHTKITVYLPDKTPAVDAIVKFIPSNRSQNPMLSKKTSVNPSVTVVRTDNEGKFQVPALADSTYNVFMEKDSLKAFQGQVAISSQGHTLHDDTLKQTGSFTAIAGLDPRDMHNVNSVVVQILGSDVQYINPQNNGTFTFENIAAGSYKLRLETSLPEYSPTFFDMTITTGVDSICPDTIWLTYTGIPSVQGLSTTFDTSSGIVTLQWQPTVYSNILDYVIYRDTMPIVTYSTIPYKATSDTLFTDTIFNINKIPADTQTIGYKYRVAIRNNSTVIGNTFGAVSATATPYKSVLPIIDSLKVMFDTLNGVANLTWKSIPIIDSSYYYHIVRNIKAIRYISSTILKDTTGIVLDTTNTIQNISVSSFTDSLFTKLLSFKDSLFYQITYSVSAFRKEWNLNGKSTVGAPINLYPYKNLVPVVSNSIISFDTLHGVATVSWDSIPASTGIGGFQIIRNITNASLQFIKTDTIPLWSSNLYSDTIYPKNIPLEAIGATQLTYAIAAYHTAWGIYGNATIKTTVAHSYKAFKPQISAGSNKTVDISSDVVLKGAIVSTTFPVIKKEWKIGDSSWIITGDSIQFKTNSEHSPETIPCIFKVTDSVGNATEDTVKVTKTPLVVTLSKFPSKSIYQSTTTTMVPLIEKTTTQDSIEYLHFGEIDMRKYGVWSTTDFKNYTLLSGNTGININGYFFNYHDNYYIYNFSPYPSYKSYKSPDAVTWDEITPVFNQGTPTTNIGILIPLKNKLLYTYRDYYASSKNKIIVSQDGINWDTTSYQIPQDPIKSLFKLGDTLALITYLNNSKYISIDEGITWSRDNLWDSDGDVFPDDFYTMAYSDSVTVVAYQERPANVFRISMFKNGIWKTIPIDIMNISFVTNYNSYMSVAGNRCILFHTSSWDFKNYTVKSFRLY